MTAGPRLTLLAFLAIAVAEMWMGLPKPDPTIRFTCPNFDTIHVMDAHWDSAKRTKRVTRVLPATCGDTTAVTYGYLR